MTDGPLADAWAWIDGNTIERRPTEILLPVELAVAPRWMPRHGGGCWGASVEIAVAFDELVDLGVISEPLGSVIECEHPHPTRNEAWACAEDLGRRVVEQIMEARRG